MLNRVLQALVATTALTAATSAFAQQAPTVAAPEAADEGGGLEDIVVTAQRRQERLQDVPIAVTAMTAETLEANRITNVADLSGLAPSTQVATAAGGIGLPQFTMRGEISYGVVPGTEKQVALYVDGAYYGAPRGLIFDIADIERIETLRGPQGTLFGRSATAGAVQIITPNPTGEFGVTQRLTFGDHEQFRTFTRVDMPEYNNFSGYVAYVHDEREGDIDNLGAGTIWTYPVDIRDEPQTAVSPETLGARDLESLLVAVEFSPTENLRFVYKYDFSENNGTPEGWAPAYNGAFLPLIAAGYGATMPAATGASRPDSVNNSFTTYNRTLNRGHNLTATWDITDSLSLTNILSVRHSYNFSQQEFSGRGGLTAPVVPVPGNRLILGNLLNQAYSDNWSDELRLNYSSDRLTLTAGLSYYDGDDLSGPPPGYVGSYPTSGTIFFGGVIPAPFAAAPRTQSTNLSTSRAAYIQAEYHVTDQLDLVGGYRITEDHKEGAFNNGTLGRFAFNYDDKMPTYLVGVNFSPSDDVLFYAKYSTGFVSGGSVGSLAFSPETVHSTEIGVKADWFDNRVRTNIAIYQADYFDVQTAFGGSQLGHPELSTVVANGGDLQVRGIEFEGVFQVTDGLTLGGSVGFVDLEQTRLAAPLQTLPVVGQISVLTGRSDTTGTLYADYETQPVFGEANLHFRMDGVYESDKNFLIFPSVPSGVLDVSPAHWIVNGRAALEGIEAGGATFDLALWGKNLFDEDVIGFTNYNAFQYGAASFIPERSVGVDITFRF